MVTIQFFVWWYGAGWLAVLKSFLPRIKKLDQAFSTTTLLKTLFSPWRRIISYPGASFDAKIRAMIDNLFSRVVGFFVRLFVLIGALVVLVITITATIIELVAWPLLPLSVIGFIVLAVF